jgi:FAD/FMN-containing dehydrogenase
MDLTSLVEQVGTDGAVAPTGSGSRWTIGGPVDARARPVRAPAGIVRIQAEEMTVRCGAATPVPELAAALAEVGQRVALPEGGTVGGALAVGRSGPLRLGHGPVRDTLLQARVVLADGTEVTAGGPTVKNVSGFDLCRLLVGSLGTLAVLGEVILRTRPLPARSAWFVAPDGSDPDTVRVSLFRPSAVLWDGATTWVCLEGHPVDVDAEASAHGLTAVVGPPLLPTAGRASVPPARAMAFARSLPGGFVAESGVGVVHLDRPWTPPEPDPVVVELNRRVKDRFDPRGRLSPGRDPLGRRAL